MLKSFFLNKNSVEAGCDEAGRGCLAGPVYAAAVILPNNYRNKWLNDSKKLSEKDRYELRPEIESKAIAWAVGVASHTEIDKINILNASFLGMHRAIDSLNIKPTANDRGPLDNRSDLCEQLEEYLCHVFRECHFLALFRLAKR